MKNKALYTFRLQRDWIFSAIFLLIAMSLFLAARYSTDFAQWYSVRVYPVLQVSEAKLFSLWKGSFFEASLIFALILILFSIVSGVFVILLDRRKWKQLIIKNFRIFLSITAFFVMVYSLNCGVNYQRDGIGIVLNLPQTEASKTNLMKLSLILADEITALTNEPEWNYSQLTEKNEAYIKSESITSMKSLGENEPSLAGYYPEPKPFHFSRLLSDVGIEGIFSPITMEANYNREMTPFLIPYVMCHELAHLKGYMKEDDAGFIAYLACRNSQNPVFRYSGLFHGLIFTLNALKTEATPEEFNVIYNRLPQQIRYQLIYVNEKSLVDSSVFTSAARAVNDYYLKANAQTGTSSYSGIVNLLLSEYKDRIDRDDLI
jgi:hypothetical protein